MIPAGNRIRLLKIDVEGCEYRVLLGARDLLGRCDFVWLEICDSFLRRFDDSTGELLSFIESQGFELFHLSDSGRIQRLQSEIFDFDRLAMVLAAKPACILAAQASDPLVEII